MLNPLLATVLHEIFVAHMRGEKDVDRLLKEQVPSQHLVIIDNDFVIKLL